MHKEYISLASDGQGKGVFSVDSVMTVKCAGVLLRSVAVSLGKYTFEMKCIDIFVLVLPSATVTVLQKKL